jgi:hypothetical protein
MFCVREDGDSMEEVARVGGYSFQRVSLQVESIPAPWQQKVFCAAPGELLEPIPHGDGFQLWRAMGRREPTLDDAGTRQRVETILLSRHFSELASRHVKWETGFIPP